MFSVIFDMDGTLLDTQKLFVVAWDYAGRLQGIEGMGRYIPCVCGMNEIGSTNYLAENFPQLDVPKFRRQMREYMKENLVVEYKDGAEKLLMFLKENGIKIGLASGTTRASVEHHLAVVGADKYIDVIVAGTEVQNGKPAPDIFLKVAELMGVNPQDCFVFEDSANGIKAGFKAGMKCIGVPDIVEFDEETKAMMFTELHTIDEAIEIFKGYIGK